jgi:hypothetical protein
MPETGIGFFPDVGCTHELNKLPPGLGLYLGLTGLSLQGADVRLSGLATHYVPSSALGHLKQTLLGPRGASLGDLRQLDSLLHEFEVRRLHPHGRLHSHKMCASFVTSHSWLHACAKLEPADLPNPSGLSPQHKAAPSKGVTHSSAVVLSTVKAGSTADVVAGRKTELKHAVSAVMFHYLADAMTHYLMAFLE